MEESTEDTIEPSGIPRSGRYPLLTNNITNNATVGRIVGIVELLIPVIPSSVSTRRLPAVPQEECHNDIVHCYCGPAEYIILKFLPAPSFQIKVVDCNSPGYLWVVQLCLKGDAGRVHKVMWDTSPVSLLKIQ